MYIASPDPRFRTDTQYHDRVPDNPRTPHWTIRVDEDLRAEFAVAAEAAGLDASAAMRMLMAWYARRSHATEPERPLRPSRAQVDAWKAAHPVRRTRRRSAPHDAAPE